MTANDFSPCYVRVPGMFSLVINATCKLPAVEELTYLLYDIHSCTYTLTGSASKHCCLRKIKKFSSHMQNTICILLFTKTVYYCIVGRQNDCHNAYHTYLITLNGTQEFLLKITKTKMWPLYESTLHLKQVCNTFNT